MGSLPWRSTSVIPGSVPKALVSSCSDAQKHHKNNGGNIIKNESWLFLLPFRSICFTFSQIWAIFMDWTIHTDFCATRWPQRSNLVSVLHFHISVFVDQYKLRNLWIEYQEFLSNLILWPYKTLFDCFWKLGCDYFSVFCGCHGKRSTYVSWNY